MTVTEWFILFQSRFNDTNLFQLSMLRRSFYWKPLEINIYAARKRFADILMGLRGLIKGKTKKEYREPSINDSAS